MSDTTGDPTADVTGNVTGESAPASASATTGRPEVPDRPTVAVLLAAGGGTRFAGDGHKLLAPLPADPDGGRPAETVFERALASLVAAGVGPVVVVTGSLTDDDLLPLVERVRRDRAIEIVHNAAWADGQMTSVRVGLDIAATHRATGVVVGLADQPGISPTAWRRVAAGLATTPIAVATYGGRRGNPVGLRSETWPLLPPGGDEGARGLMRIRPELVGEVPCSGSSADIDTLEDLRRWQNN